VIMTNLSQAQWRKASKSNGANTGCVEVATNLTGVVGIRDSKHPELGAHVVHPEAFTAFLADVRSGRYDL